MEPNGAHPTLTLQPRTHRRIAALYGAAQAAEAVAQAATAQAQQISRQYQDAVLALLEANNVDFDQATQNLNLDLDNGRVEVIDKVPA